MAEQGTFKGEVQRGWRRFWASSWKVKGPVVAVVAILVVGGIGAAIGEDDEPVAASVEAEEPGSNADPGNTGSPTLEATATPEDTPTPSPTPEPTETPTQTPTPTPSPSPTPSPTPEPAGYRFGDGTKLVGEDVIAGETYRAPNADGCYWERLTGLGGSLDEIAANDNADGPAVVTIGVNDVAFNSSRCGSWSLDLSPLTVSPDEPFEGGTWIVGLDISAGTWRAEGGSDSCYWARLAGFSREIGDVITNDFGNPSPVVSIAASDAGFQATAACGQWSKIE